MHLSQEALGDSCKLTGFLTFNHGEGDKLRLTSICYCEPEDHWSVESVLSEALVDEDDV